MGGPRGTALVVPAAGHALLGLASSAPCAAPMPSSPAHRHPALPVAFRAAPAPASLRTRFGACRRTSAANRAGVTAAAPDSVFRTTALGAVRTPGFLDRFRPSHP